MPSCSASSWPTSTPSSRASTGASTKCATAGAPKNARRGRLRRPPQAPRTGARIIHQTKKERPGWPPVRVQAVSEGPNRADDASCGGKLRRLYYDPPLIQELSGLQVKAEYGPLQRD